MKKFLIKVNGNQYEVEVEEVKSGTAAKQPESETQKAPSAAPAPAVPAEKSTPKKDTSVPAGAQTVMAPMPGTIIKVDVSKGDEVSKGQVLIVLEAMKMENEIVAPSDGKIVSVNVEKDASVDSGDVLISME